MTTEQKKILEHSYKIIIAINKLENKTEAKKMTYQNANDFLLKYASKKMQKASGNKLQEYKRLKKIATDNLYHNNVLRKKSLIDLFLGT